ncbi:hypothetical protein [Azospirillum endophyticum]
MVIPEACPGHLDAIGGRTGPGDGVSGISKSQVSRVCAEADERVSACPSWQPDDLGSQVEMGDMIMAGDAYEICIPMRASVIPAKAGIQETVVQSG